MSFEQIWSGSNVNTWWNQVVGRRSGYLESLASAKLNRAQLKTLCQTTSGATSEECLAAVMAWGGQHREHGRRLFSNPSKVLEVVNEVRCGQLDRQEAYKNFYRLWIDGNSPGMGAAYFTKLIFFLLPNHDGYIMDQWTSKSVNLILEKPLVHLNNGYVSQKNNYLVYEEFCRTIEQIAQSNGNSPEDIEMAMFSSGGKNKAAWRQYVVNNFR